MSRIRTVCRPVALALVIVVTLAGACGDDDGEGADPTTVDGPTTTVSPADVGGEGEEGDGAGTTPSDAVDPAGPPGAATPTSSVVYAGGEDGIDTYRIPGAVVSPAGTILVFAEARSLSPHDLDPRRLVVRRSEDLGTTWGPITPIVPADVDPECDHTDPVPVAPTVGDAAGEVIVLFRSCGLLGSARSSDDGVTWSPRTDLTIDAGPLPAELAPRLRAGPGHGIELTGSAAPGRLVVVTDIGVDGETHTQLLLSDDGGDTWRVGAHHRSVDADGPDPDETAVTELADGTILVSARNGSTVSPGRIQLRSSDGGETFDPAADGATLVLAPELTVPVVEGALITEPATGLAVFSSPSDPLYRRGARLWTSPDGHDWREGPLLSADPAAYTDLVVLPTAEPAVGVIVETGDRGLYERIDFVVVPADELTTPGPPLPDDYDPADAVSGRVVLDGVSFEILRYCVAEDRILLDGGWIEPDLSGGLEEVGFVAHVDDRGDGTPLDLDGVATLDLQNGIRFRGSIDDTEGVAHEIDLVLVNAEVCPG